MPAIIAEIKLAGSGVGDKSSLQHAVFQQSHEGYSGMSYDKGFE